MITAPANWAALWGAPGTAMEMAFAMNGKTYYNDSIEASSCKLTHQLYQEWGIGNASSAKLALTLLTDDDMPDGAAKATLKARLKGASKTTSWVSQGTYYLDTAERTESGTVKLVLYDGLALTDCYLYDGGTVPPSESYPRNALTMARAIASACSLTLDESNKSLWQSVSCTAPEGMTCRQVLQSIAAAAGGNWTMTKAGKLHFQPLGDLATATASGYTATVANYSQQGGRKTALKVSLHDGDDTYTRGAGGYEVAAQCAFASDGNVAIAFAAVNGCQYQGFKAQGAHVSPLCELGDLVAVAGDPNPMMLDSCSLTYQQGLWGDIEAPLRDEVVKRIGAMDRRARLDRIAKYAALIDELDQTITSGEIFDAIIDKLNAKANETGGWFYYVEGQGVRTYDREVSDPAVGAEASQCVEIRGGTIRIANSKKNGQWEWRTVFSSGHIAAELVTAVNVNAGYIGSPSGNYWNLDTGELRMLTTTQVGNTTLGGISDKADSAKSTAEWAEGAVINVQGDVSGLKAGSANGVDVEYGVSSSPSAYPTSWQTHADDLWKRGKYLWSRQRLTMYDNTLHWTPPRLLSSGSQVIRTLDEEYYLSTSKAAPVGGSWASRPQAYIDGRYYFTRTRILWDNSTVTYVPNANGELAQAFTTVVDVYDNRLDQARVFNKLTKNGTAKGMVTDARGNLFFNANYISTGILADKRGANYWNLDTGDFRLSSVAALEDRLDTLSVGSANLMNGTGDWTGWGCRGAILLSSGEATMPAQVADWGVSLISPLAAVEWSMVVGNEVTVSFDMMAPSAWGAVTATNSVYVSLEVFSKARNSRTRTRWRNFQVTQAPTGGWKRVSFTTPKVQDSLFTGGTGTIYSNSGFGIEIFNRSNKRVMVRRVKVELGAMATDWCATEHDAKADATAKANKALSDGKDYTAAQVKAAKTETRNYAKKYTDDISAKDRQYTDQQKKDLDDSLNAEKVFNKLTKNGTVPGLYTSRDNKGKVTGYYFNATYIQTGVLDAKVLKAGIIEPKRKTNGEFKINMDTGYISTKNMEANNIKVNSGSMTVASGSVKLKMSGGQLLGYRGSDLVGYIDPTAKCTIIGSKTQKVLKTVYGMQVQSNGIVRITSPRIGVASTSDVGVTATLGFTGSVRLHNVTFNMAKDMSSSKSGSVELKFVNGIFTGIGEYTLGLASATKQEGQGM